MSVDIRKASRYLGDIFEPALYEAAKCFTQHIDPFRNFPETFRAFNSALNGYWGLIGDADEPTTLRDSRIRIQRKIAEKFHIVVLGDGQSGLYGLTFGHLEEYEDFEYGRDYRVTPKAKFEWLNPRAYGNAPEPEEESHE